MFFLDFEAAEKDSNHPRDWLIYGQFYKALNIYWSYPGHGHVE